VNVSVGIERLLLVVAAFGSGLLLLIHLVLINAALTESMPNLRYMGPEEYRSSVLGASLGSLLTAFLPPLNMLSRYSRAKIKWLLLMMTGLAISWFAWLGTLMWVYQAAMGAAVGREMLSGFLGGTLATIGLYVLIAAVLLGAVKLVVWVGGGFANNSGRS
jgi:Na+/phosphate symporter